MDSYIIGSLSDEIKVNIDVIDGLLCQAPQVLSHGGAFTGKPDTQIYADETWVLKINSRRSFTSETVAERWCKLQIEREKEYQIYHPDRTWLMIHDENWLVANISPRLKPLHMFDFGTFSAEERVWAFSEIMRIYCEFTVRFDKRLDEGLSNFGCLQGKLWYLDDDIYAWDNFSSFSAMLANWLRKSDELGLDVQSWSLLGNSLWPRLRSYSSSADDVVHEALVDQFVGGDEALKQVFLAELRPSYRIEMAQAASGDFSPLEPIGLIADVHANLPAFEVVLAEFSRRGISQIMMLGDIVGYGPHPKACIALAKQHGVFCVRGNHDHYVAHNGDVRVASSSLAKWTLDWTLSQLDDMDKQWLGALPVRHRMPGWMAVHGSPIDKTFFNGYVYNMTAEKNLDHLRTIDIPICLHGHSHIQGVYAMKNRMVQPYICSERVNLSDFSASLVCPGSVGQPRMGVAQAEGAVFYPDSLDLELFSLPYDIEKVAADMESFDFPAKAIERLREGR
ncbi:phosphodiesterase [Mariprofundus micogutta]|uniref:Phosphodiesterase n=1 Tax=Mariprofundus micogutta TaxID=1921010 RepID=A0A1L8CLS5_9PROT|nr:metallophosphoesterase family protein [Mariprofundus micogutta]GAV19862.1 phosphodiesterase [Mariprofundus micogutta]